MSTGTITPGRALMDDTCIPIPPRLVKHLGSYAAAALVVKTVLLYEQNGNRPFTMFNAPCGHPLYANGESWAEVLGVSRDVVMSALKKVAFREGGGARRKLEGRLAAELGRKPTRDETDRLEAQERGRALVVYRTDMDRVSTYRPNLEAIFGTMLLLRGDGR